MIEGSFHNSFPRITLDLPGRNGDVTIEFIVDTGFSGDLALPASMLSALDADFVKEELIQLANGTFQRSALYAIEMEWDEEPRLVEISIMREGNPLLGIGLLLEHLLQMELTGRGEVSVESL